jgi:hypothetical protein
MHTDRLRTIAYWLERAVILLALGALVFRATLYGAFPRPVGAAYGSGDIIDYLLGLALFLLSGACAAVGVLLTTRVDASGKAAAYRPVLIGMTTFVVYYLVHPHVPALGPGPTP